MEDNDLIIYKNKDGNIIVDAIYKDETLWLTQKGMSKVFDCSTDNISLHLKNIFKDNELDENLVVEDSSVTASDGKNYKTKIYNLDAIIAVGYRVNSKKATEFRIWATKILKEYMTKGFALNDDRLLVKIVESNKKYNMKESIPYDGAKPMYLVDDVDNQDTLKDIVLDTCKDLKK